MENNASNDKKEDEIQINEGNIHNNENTNINENINQINIINNEKENRKKNERVEDLDKGENDIENEIGNIDEDLYMQELYLRLAQMKNERKEAENNAKLLDNRLNLLKGEEQKTWKKIENTKKKATEKLIHLQTIVENRRQKEEGEKRKKLEIERKKILNKKMTNEIKLNTDIKKAQLHKQIQDEAKLIKSQKEHNKKLINFLKDEKINQNKSKCACVKSQKLFNDEKKKIIQSEKRMRLREELERKLIEEYRLKEEAESKRCKAEQEEMEIIKKLQTTTQLHKNITDELDKINLNSVMRGDYGFLGDNLNIKNNINSQNLPV